VRAQSVSGIQTGNGGDTFDGGYFTVEEIETFMAAQAAAHPSLAERVDIGDSWCKTHPGACTVPDIWNGYDLWAMHITNRNIAGPKPVFWFDAGIHSREIATPELAIRFISWLLDRYDTDPDAHWLVDYHDIWVMPTANPDGHHMVESGGDIPTYHRKNADNDDGCTTYDDWGVDLNRNFPFMWACCGGSTNDPCDMNNYRGPTENSEEETQAIVTRIRSLIPDQRGPDELDPVPITGTGVFQSMHSHGLINFFPWVHTVSPSPNHDSLRNIAAHMSALDAGGNGYPYCNNCHAIIDGSSADWAYGELGAAAVTTEIGGGSFAPPYEEVDGLWNENREMLLYLAKIARTPYLTARGPDANDIATFPLTVTQGTNFEVTGVINHAWAGNSYSQTVAAAEYYIDSPPWLGGTPAAMSGDYSSATVQVSAQVSSSSLAPGRHILFVRGRGVQDYEGFHSWGPVSAAFVYVLPQTGTPVTTPTATSTATAQPAATVTATATSVVCVAQFTDVPIGSTFYSFIRCLACRGIVSGYADGTFKPNNNVTRGQLSKIVSNAAGLNEPVTGQTFQDVPPGSTFYDFIERLASRGVMSGYPCGSLPTEPCVPPENRPYFRPNNNATRGQISSIISNAAGYSDPVNGQTFEDVPPGSTFYDVIGRLVSRGIITGYPCGGTGEPCNPPSNRPYFRPNRDATRGQASKIVANAFSPNCEIVIRK
jgi:hypothetical protein